MPTLAGYGLLAVILIMLIASVITNQFFGKALVVLLASIGLIAMFMTHSNLREISCESIRDVYTSENSMGRLAIDILNQSLEPKISLMVAADRKSSFKVLGLLDENRRDTVKLDTRLSDRGVFQAPDIKIQSVYPLGLFSAWIWVKPSSTIYVFPKPIGRFSKPERDGDGSTEITGTTDVIGDFSGYRNFRPGDSYRHADWKAYGRGRPLLIKEFTGGGRHQKIFRYGDTPQHKVEDKLRQLSAWVHEAHRIGDQYALELPTQFIMPGEGEGHFLSCLRELAAFETV